MRFDMYSYRKIENIFPNLHFRSRTHFIFVFPEERKINLSIHFYWYSYEMQNISCDDLCKHKTHSFNYILRSTTRFIINCRDFFYLIHWCYSHSYDRTKITFQASVTNAKFRRSVFVFHHLYPFCCSLLVSIKFKT